MIFSEKLDFLMRLTKTTNSALALNISVDPSYISRLRNGKRKPAKNENYLEAMSYYIAKNCTDPHCRASLKDMAGISYTPETTEETRDVIYRWLSEDYENNTEKMGSFLGSFSHFQFKKPQASSFIPAQNEQELEFKPVYYGVAGKREAVIKLLTEVTKSDKPKTLLLFSDEDIDWLTEDKEFTSVWANLMIKVIMKGNRIKIIHTVSRNLDEMLNALGEWMPLYMTGAIEPYYYPKKRDGVFRRTLFICPETIALASTSIGSMTENTANFMTQNNRTIESLIYEFESYLNLCRPLMKIFTPSKKDEYFAILSEFDKEMANSIIKSEPLSSFSMPEAVINSITSRLNLNDRDKIITYHNFRMENFIKNLHQNKISEIIKLPDIEKIKGCNVRVPFADMLEQKDFCYSVSEFKEHLEGILKLLKAYENYHVFLTEEGEVGNVIYIKENIGALVGKTEPPSVFFAINEDNMTAALWDYLESIIEKAAAKKHNKEFIISKLEAVIAEL
jgi:hypothetical protein